MLVRGPRKEPSMLPQVVLRAAHPRLRLKVTAWAGFGLSRKPNRFWLAWLDRHKAVHPKEKHPGVHQDSDNGPCSQHGLVRGMLAKLAENRF